MKKSVKEIADIIGGIVQGDGKLSIKGITGIDTPQEGAIAFVSDKRRLAEAEKTELACLIAPVGSQSSKKTLIVADNPRLCWAKLLHIFHPPRNYETLLSEKAYVSKTAKIANDAHIESFAYIGEHVTIGKGTVIRAFAYIDDDVKIGDSTIIHPNASIYNHTQIGSRVVIHSGAVIGSDGFGYVHTSRAQEKIPQIGNVVIEDDVEIGACATVDRATAGSTIIRQGAKIDNLVQVAHNVEIGKHSAISAHTGVSGSSKIGDHVTLAGQVGVSDHCEVGDGATIGAQAGLGTAKRVPPGVTLFGSPARPYEDMRKQMAAQMKLAGTIKKVNRMEKRIAELEGKLKELAPKTS